MDFSASFAGLVSAVALTYGGMSPANITFPPALIKSSRISAVELRMVSILPTSTVLYDACPIFRTGELSSFLDIDAIRDIISSSP